MTRHRWKRNLRYVLTGRKCLWCMVFLAIVFLTDSRFLFADSPEVQNAAGPAETAHHDQPLRSPQRILQVFSDSSTTEKEESTSTHAPRQLKFSAAKRFVRRPFKEHPDCAHFTIKRVLKKHLPPVALASYPGSGNTWVRYLIEAVSGIYTGSIYKDANLYFEGFWGELADWDAGVTVVQKTHDAGFGHIRSFDNGKGIFLMRNPYDAILSFHNFIYGGHTGFAPSANFMRPEWADFVHHQSRHWLITAMNWTEYSTRLLVVHYESLLEDPVPQLERILRFLQVPIDPQRLDCIRKYPRGNFKRTTGEKPEGKLSIFPAENRRSMDRAIRYMNYLMSKHNQPSLPLDKYNYYNDTPPKKRRHNDENAEEIGWFESLSRGYTKWAPRLISSLMEDPLMKNLREAGGSDSYSYRIRFDPEFRESAQLDRDFNSGPPPAVKLLAEKRLSITSTTTEKY